QHVEVPGRPHEPEPRRIHVRTLVRDIRKLARHLQEDASKVRHRRQHIRLVDTGDHAGTAVCAAPPCDLERKRKQPFTYAATDLHGIENRVPGAVTEPPSREQTLGRFTHEYEVNLLRSHVRQRKTYARNRPNWAHAGVQAKLLPKIELGGD